jgi:hypothetical protein
MEVTRWEGMWHRKGMALLLLSSLQTGAWLHFTVKKEGAACGPRR